LKKFDLYEIAIKLLGLYLVVVIIGQLRDILIFLAVLVQSQKNSERLGEMNQTIAFVVAILGFIVLIIFSGLLIFRTRQITKLICRPTDSEEHVKLFAEKKTIYEICLVLLGLITIVLTIPDFIFKLKNHISLIQNNFPTKDYDTTFLITSGIKIAVGIIAIIYSAQLSKVLTKKKKEENKPND